MRHTHTHTHTHTNIYDSSYHVICILTILQLNKLILYTYPVIIFLQFIGQLPVESKKETIQNTKDCSHYAETVRIYNTVDQQQTLFLPKTHKQ